MLLDDCKKLKGHATGLLGPGLPLLYSRFARVEVAREHRLADPKSLAQFLDLLRVETRRSSKTIAVLSMNCMLLRSSEMRLLGAERAIVDIAKLREYCLNPQHPRGRHKARVFASALNLHQSDAEFLRTQLLNAARTSDVLGGEADGYGQRYILDFECVKGSRRAVVRSAWIVLESEDFPRLTTCYVLSD
jgi:hypothetical protein